MAKRKRYTDDFRAGAVLMYEANPNFVEVANHLKIPESTLRSWVNRAQQLDKEPSRSGVVAEVYDKKKIDFAAAIDAEMAAILNEMQYKREEAFYNQLGTVFGILFDKKQLLSGGPTSNQNQRILVQYAE